MKGTGAAIAGALAFVLVLVLAATVSMSVAAGACLPAGVAVVGAVPASVGLDAEQQANARAIAATVVQRRMPTRAAVIAVATAMQESSLRNLAYGDRDSLGLFQQRPSQGWGAPVQVLDPVHATHAFLDRLREIPDWPLLPLTVAAQAVQRSGYPAAYAAWEEPARAVVAGLLGRPAAPAQADGTATDTPGLHVLGDALAADLSTQWPPVFQGGVVRVDAARYRTSAQGLAALGTARDLAGTWVVSLGADDPATVVTSGRFARRITALLRVAGPERTVYWMTSPFGSPRMNAAVRRVAAGDRRLQVIEVAAAVATHPGWAAGAELTEAGVVGVGALVRRSVGADPGSEPGAGPGSAGFGPGCGDGLGGYGAVPVADCSFVLARGNPRGCQDAVRWALAQSDGPPLWYRRCLNFVARAYGYSASGIPTAAAFWAAAPDKHLGDPNPPAGALVFWHTGRPAGHVALSAGGGMVISNDIGGAGTISAVSLADLSARWNADYLGWAPPFFPRGI